MIALAFASARADPGTDPPAITAVQPLPAVAAAALSRDGRYLVVGLEDNAAVLWDVADGRPVRTFAGHERAVLSVAFSPDGHHVLTGSGDKTAVLWDARTGNPVRTFKGHARGVNAVAFSPAGKHILTGSADGTARVWRVSTGKPSYTLTGHAKEITAVAFSPDGKTLATASTDATAILWKEENGERAVVLKGHTEGLSCVAFSPDGRRVGTGSFENLGVVWDAATGERLATTARHGNDVVAVAFTADGRQLITGDRDELIQTWDAATGAKDRTLAGHAADVVSLEPRADGRLLLSGSRDGTARLWDLAAGRELLALTTDAARKSWAVVAPDGLFDASESGRHAMGFRFTKPPVADLDQLFDGCYRPGLLAEVVRGGRPAAGRPPGEGKPPLLRLVGPRIRTSPAPRADVTVEVADQGGGMSGLAVEVNGAVVPAPGRVEPGPGGKTTFAVRLVPGVNRVRVRAANADGSFGAAPAEVEITAPRPPGDRSRLYVVAVGVGRYAEERWNLPHPAADARELADLFRRRGTAFDRVDVIPVSDRDATRAGIEDIVRDVAELTRPQDALIVLLCGRGAVVGDGLYFAPHDLRVGTDRPDEALRARGLSAADLAAAVGTAPAVNRALVVDAVAFGEVGDGFALRGAVERLTRAWGVVTAAAIAPPPGGDRRARGRLTEALLAVAGGPGGGRTTETLPNAGAADVADVFRAAADLAGRNTSAPAGTAQSSSRGRAFPLIGPDL